MAAAIIHINVSKQAVGQQSSYWQFPGVQNRKVRVTLRVDQASDNTC